MIESHSKHGVSLEQRRVAESPQILSPDRCRPHSSGAISLAEIKKVLQKGSESWYQWNQPQTTLDARMKSTIRGHPSLG